MNVPLVILAGVGALELLAAGTRFASRQAMFREAGRRAQRLRRPIVVIGDPNAGATTSLLPAYGCGDVTIDLRGAPECPRAITADITRGPVPGIAPNSAVVFVSCVLEYTADPQRAWAEVLRIAGEPANVYMVTVQPWTVTAALYPGAQWTIQETRDGDIEAAPVTDARKFATVAMLGVLSIAAVRRM